jgi:hypothetical protein
MRLLFFVTLFFVFTLNLTAQDNSNKTLVRVLDPEASSNMVIKFKTVSISKMPWDDQGFCFELLIKANMPVQILEQLLKAGRYEIDGVKYGDSYYVIAPNIDKNVTVRGKDLEEQITLVIKTPGNYDLTDNVITKNMDHLAGRDGNEVQVKEYMKIKNQVKVNKANLQTTLKSNQKLKLKKGDIIIDGVAIEVEE